MIGPSRIVMMDDGMMMIIFSARIMMMDGNAA
jgi:hypothetical protein